MPIAAVPEWIVDLGVYAAVVSTVGALIGATVALVRRMLRAEISEVVAQLTPNGGDSLADKVDTLSRQVRRIFADRADDKMERIRRQASRDQHDRAVEERLDAMERTVARLVPILLDFAASHPEVRRLPDDDDAQAAGP